MQITNEKTFVTPTTQEVDKRIANARRAQSDELHRLVTGTLAAIDRRFRHRIPAAS